MNARALLQSPTDLRALQARVKAEKARRSLAEFVRQAWPIVEPSMPLVWGWHVDAICQHLEAVTRGEILRLVINVPPGHAKSILVSVMWPAWEWATNPATRSLFASYAEALAVRDSVRCRDLIESDWYVRSFRGGSHPWGMKGDSNAKDWFQNTRTGFRVSLSVGGQGTGWRGDKVVVDDPHNVKTAASALEREAVARWWNVAMSSRFNDMSRARRVIIMQRLHEEDLTGVVLAQGGYEHLRLPSLFESKRRCRTFAVRSGARVQLFEDPRTVENAPLFPALFPRPVLDQALADLKPTDFAAQHQQRPVPAEGGTFKKAWWRFWKPAGTAPELQHPRPDGCYTGPARELPAKFDRVVISLDANFKGNQAKGNDPIVFVVIGCSGADRFVLDRVRAFVGFGETLAQFRLLCARWPKAYRKLVEAKANGEAIIETLKTEVGGIVPVTPEGGKESRASAIAPQVEGGNVYLPDGAPWVDEWVAEFAAFPRGAHDDQVDALSQALIDQMPNGDAERFRALSKW